MSESKTNRYYEHVRDLAEQNGIAVLLQSSPNGRANRRERIIKIRSPKSIKTYASALHTMGYLLGEKQDQERLFQESGAWEWALSVALPGVAEADQFVSAVNASLEISAKDALLQHERGLKNAKKLPPAEDPFWVLPNGTTHYRETLLRYL